MREMNGMFPELSVMRRGLAICIRESEIAFNPMAQKLGCNWKEVPKMFLLPTVAATGAPLAIGNNLIGIDMVAKSLQDKALGIKSDVMKMLPDMNPNLKRFQG